MAYKLGVDVGGTFTDLFMIDDADGQVFTAKVPSTPMDPSIAVINGIRKLRDDFGIDTAAITELMHGTTVATNAVLTGEGARVGLIVTEGYRDVLHIARSWVPGGLGAWINYEKSPLLAPLQLTVEAIERTGADGKVVNPLDEDGLVSALQRLIDARVEAVTICLFNSYANPANEIAAKAVVERTMPGVPVTISSETVAEIQEFERTITTVTNSFVKPVVERYVRNLQSSLGTEAGGSNLRILRSDGGLCTAPFAADFPVNLLMSGPAGGVSGAIWVAKRAGFPNIITFDMGGTSTDVALVQDGVAQIRRETTIGDISVRASSVDVRTVGAGGGSIAHVPDITGALRVGPKSAGSVPGPAAYDKGGTLPTVTDANVVLGFLTPRARLGGAMAIRPDLAEAAVATIAEPLGLTVKEAAEGIIRIVNENMFGALRLVSIEQGYDPADFALMGFGGAGPLHANALGILLGAWPVIIPPGPGVLCAAGDATTSLRDEAARTYIKTFDAAVPLEISLVLEELRARACKALVHAGIPAREQKLTFQADVRYSGQANEITVDFEDAAFDLDALTRLGATFDTVHDRLFTFKLDAQKEFVNLRVIAEGPNALVEGFVESTNEGDLPTPDFEDEIFYEGQSWKTGVFRRECLKSGHVIEGPAIVTQMDTTTIILPKHRGTVDAFGNILIRPSGKGA